MWIQRTSEDYVRLHNYPKQSQGTWKGFFSPLAVNGIKVKIGTKIPNRKKNGRQGKEVKGRSHLIIIYRKVPSTFFDIPLAQATHIKAPLDS